MHHALQLATLHTSPLHYSWHHGYLLYLYYIAEVLFRLEFLSRQENAYSSTHYFTYLVSDGSGTSKTWISELGKYCQEMGFQKAFLHFLAANLHENPISGTWSVTIQYISTYLGLFYWKFFQYMDRRENSNLI